MSNDTTLYVGLDVHIDAGEVELMGKIGTTPTDIDRLYKRLQSKARHVRVVYEADPCGYGLYRRLARRGFDCMVGMCTVTDSAQARRASKDRSAGCDQVGAFLEGGRPVGSLRAECSRRSFGTLLKRGRLRATI